VTSAHNTRTIRNIALVGHARSGRIAGSDVVTGNRVRVSAQVPLAELGDYQTTLKSLTGGEGLFTWSSTTMKRCL